MNKITVMGLKESYCDNSTCKYYEQNLSFFFEFLESEFEKPIDHIPVDSLAPDIVQSYIKHLRFKPKYENHPFKIGEEKKGKLKNSTIISIPELLRCFSTIFVMTWTVKLNLKGPGFQPTIPEYSFLYIVMRFRH